MINNLDPIFIKVLLAKVRRTTNIGLTHCPLYGENSNLLGREVALLLDETRPAGTYQISFDAGSLPSGVYFYRLQAGDFIQTKTMVLTK